MAGRRSSMRVALWKRRKVMGVDNSEDASGRLIDVGDVIRECIC